MIAIRGLLIIALSAAASVPLLAEHAATRLGEATTVFKEVMAAPDKGIPQDLLAKAHCVVIVPNLKKAAFVVGGQYGRGLRCAGRIIMLVGELPLPYVSKAVVSDFRLARSQRIS